MSPLTGTLISLLFLTIGMVMVIIMLNLQGNPKKRPREALIKKTHRILGYIFALLYIVMLVGMIIKISGTAIEFSPRIAIHFSLALLLFPLLLIKILIVRYYKRFHYQLVNIGLIIFFLSFVLVVIGAGYFLLNANTPASKNPSTQLSKQEQLNQLYDKGKKILSNKCSLCHNHDRINRVKKNQQDWKNTLERMVKYSRNPQYLTDKEFAILIDYLSTREPTPLPTD